MSELVTAADFKTALDETLAALKTHASFERALRNDASAYVDRVDRRGSLAMDRSDAVQLSVEYVAHEVAMYLCMARRGYLLDAYVGQELPVLRQFITGEISGCLSPLAQRAFLSLRPEEP